MRNPVRAVPLGRSSRREEADWMDSEMSASHVGGYWSQVPTRSIPYKKLPRHCRPDGFLRTSREPGGTRSDAFDFQSRPVGGSRNRGSVFDSFTVQGYFILSRTGQGKLKIVFQRATSVSDGLLGHPAINANAELYILLGRPTSQARNLRSGTIRRISLRCN